MSAPRRNRKKFNWRIKEIVIGGKRVITSDDFSVLILVGPNNSGKSTALREILSHLIGTPKYYRVVKKLETKCYGSPDALKVWLEKHYPKRLESDGRTAYYTAKAVLGSNEIQNVFVELCKSYERGLGDNSRFFTDFHSSEARLTLANEQKAISLLLQRAEAPIHLLQMNDRLMDEFAKRVLEAFGEGIAINWAGGERVFFHVGDIPKKKRTEERVSPSYIERLTAVPQMHKQGDGIRAFVGILLALIATPFPILIIDEPEAFLHPHQCERLGNLIARYADKFRRQVILATHSSSIVRGAVRRSTRVAVCRISRELRSTQNDSKLLPARQLAQLWRNPLLDSVSAVEGLFSHAVAICEADGDCRFYEHLMRHLEEKGSIPSPADIYFVPTGGKGQLATLANIYHKLGIKVAVIADLDLLNKAGEFQKVVTALGGRFSNLRSTYELVSSSLETLPPPRTVKEAVWRAQQIFVDIQNANKIQKKHKEELSLILAESGKWTRAKYEGINVLKGTALQEAKKLITICEDFGLFLVPVGTRESWWPEKSRHHKLKWLNLALKDINRTPQAFKSAMRFVKAISNYVHYRP